MLSSSGARPTVHRVKVHWTELFILSLSLCCSLGQVTIQFSSVSTVPITEGATVTTSVCLVPRALASNDISFSLSASPGTLELTLPTNPFVPQGRSCETFTITSMDNNVRQDTRTFQISLSSSTVDVDQNQSQFLINIQDNDSIPGGTVCPTPTVINSSPVSCNSRTSGSICMYRCNNGFVRLSGDDSRTCNRFTFRWSGNPLFCIPIIQLQRVSSATFTEGSGLIGNVCLVSSALASNDISFSLSASPGTSELALPTNLFILQGRSCETVTITSMDNNVRQDTRTFQISLSSSTADVDQNQSQFFINVEDNDITPGGTFSCPTPTGINSSPESCSSTSGSVCTNVCNSGFERLYGDASRTCITNSLRWSGSPLFCIQIVDECSLGTHNCFRTASCANAMGSFTCTCPTGYFGDGVTCTFIDSESPVVDCSNVIYMTTAPAGASGVTIMDLPRCSATDDSGQADFVSWSPSSRFFPLGDTLVTVVYRDPSGKTGTGSFTVTVLPDVIITCPMDGVGVLQTGTIIGVWSDPVCTGGVPPFSISCTPQSRSVINVGDTQVTCTCTDTKGTTKQCSFIVSVDDDPPIISNCPTNIVVNIHAGQTQGAATWTEPSAFDVSGDVTVSPSRSPGDKFPVGSTRVTYEFIDRFNNMATCSFIVVVYAVAIDCPPSITIPYGNQLSYVTPQCTRNSGGSTSQTLQSTCIPQSGRITEDVTVICSCSSAAQITCNFQVTVMTSIQCPPSTTISPGEMLFYDTPQCMSSQGSSTASCLPPLTGSPVTLDTSFTCSCPPDGSVQCSFQIFVDCLAVLNSFCGNPGVSCDCMDESCDENTGICSRHCTVANTCPASVESKSLSQVNPSSSVDITCTLKGSTTILDNLQVRLLIYLDDNAANAIPTRNKDNTGDKVVLTFRVENVSEEQKLFCVLMQGNHLIGGVNVTNFVYELPVLNAAPISENISNNSISIIWRAWDATMDDGDPPIVAYIPYYRMNASDKWISGPRILMNETLEFKADNLEVDTLYEFSVAAVRDGENGEGRRSPAVPLKTYCNVPEEPVSVNVQITSSNRVNVSWQLPPGEVMCSTGVTSYKVYYRIEGSTDDTPQLAGTVEDADTTSLIVDDGLLEPGSSYIFFVTIATDQESGFSESEAIKTPASGNLIAIVGAVIGIAVLLILLLLVILVLVKRKKDKQADDNTPAPKPVDNTYDNPVFGIPDGHRQGALEPSKSAGPELKMQTSVREDYENKSVENLNVENESPSDDVIYGNLEQPKPIRVAEFGEYFRQNVDKFDHEFSILEGSTQLFDWMAAEDPANKKKNRFKNMYTYDHSRVVLRNLPDQEGSDYYNASFIKDTNDVAAYIASQAPNRASLEDFVRMIWEQHVTTIVMVANLFEDGKERCLQYWPENEGGSTSFGSVTVIWSKTTQFSDFVIRYFTFNRGRETREVQQLHFLTWPDKDTPEHGTSLIEFTKQSKLLHRGKKYPMLVHCSAGIGRTGTFICLSCMMDVLRDDEYIDVFGFVNKMRQNRINMVQTSKQYVFLYKCLNEYHLTYQTEMSIREMTRLDVESQRGIFLGEFELLSELGHTHRKDTVKNCLGKKKENIARNRVRNMVPSNRNRVFLMSPGQSNEENYINASYVKSFQKKDAFVTTQSPLPNTIEDFWRMVYDVKSPLIVMLNQLDPADKTCVQYWPDRGSSEYGNMYVTCVATERQSDYTQRTFEVKHVNSKEVLPVTHLQLEEWRPDINLQGIVGLIKDVDMMQKRDQYTRSIVIHCINGFERSGVMVTVKSELERIAVTERIDVFSTVKKLRDQHEHMLKNKDDYILCYHLLKAYLANSNSNYENSEDLRRGGVM